MKTSIEKTTTGWRLRRGDKPYFVRGAGGAHHLEELVAAGGNSIRTWGADEVGGMLDKCQRLGLTTTLGIWLGHKEHGFRYTDPKAVAGQFEAICGHVSRYKDHPALLCWALGNEMENGLDEAETEAMWKHIEQAAQYIHKTDPNHVTMTVVAEISDKKLAQIKTLAPSVDILGVNAYGGAASLPERLKKAGWTKPYIITEFGPLGPWEVGKTEWGAAREENSTQKAKRYAESYAKAIAGQPNCLGSYVFQWDDKIEGTVTWFGMFLPKTGEKLAAVDALTQAWTGKPVAKPCPELLSLSSAAEGKSVAPGSTLSATLTLRASGPVQVRWELRRENNTWLTELPGEPDKPFTLPAPTEPGAYRLFAYVRDRSGGAATANFAFQVK